ncbi:M48 family metallopeptidase [Actinoalloteichus spitiensis]|uniref:M48 family metallopeptidase n=1 Tax=Actinoalloteichus spitiensis TaxID=252394 RepID=UPI0003600B90|nr:M48 family metallopeptidase [Actinoalloteichus spitiensis]
MATDEIDHGEHAHRVRFPGISPRAYEHPADRGALATLRAVPPFAAVLRAVNGMTGERSERLLSLASHIRVSESQFPEIQALRLECASTLDLPEVPEVFVARDPRPNAECVGMDRPFIVLTSGLVELMDTASLRFAIGHEMGHALSGHAVYRTLMNRLQSIMAGMGWMPVGYWGIRAVLFALADWYRRSELSCDRAGLLCAQDAGAALRAHMIMAGATDPDRVDTAEFLRQARDYDGVESLWDSLLKLRQLEMRTHPLAVVRAAELQRWAAGEEYRSILSGDYPRRETDDPAADWRSDIRKGARSYTESLARSTDPLARLANEVGGAVSGVASRFWERFGGAPTGGARGGDDPAGPSAGAEGTRDQEPGTS